jgi:hypothetical protein
MGEVESGGGDNVERGKMGSEYKDGGVRLDQGTKALLGRVKVPSL